MQKTPQYYAKDGSGQFLTPETNFWFGFTLNHVYLSEDIYYLWKFEINGLGQAKIAFGFRMNYYGSGLGPAKY